MIKSAKYALLFLVLLTTFHVAATEYKIFGYVYLPNREAASYASVQVNGSQQGTMTRENGYYELEFSIPDTGSVSFRYVGCKTQVIPINGKRKNIQRIVYLEEDATLLNEVSIREFKRENSTMNNLDINDLNLIPSQNGGIESVLTTQAGVASHNELSSQYSVRGGSYDENCIYVNGIEIYRPLLIRTGEQEGLSFINSDMVESVNFSAGGFAPSYGDKMASVLDIRYKQPKGAEGSVTGSFLGGQAYFGQGSKNGRFTQLHGIRYKSSDYLFRSLDTEGDYEQKFIDYQTYLTLQFCKNWKVGFLGNFSRNRYNSIPESRTATFGTILSPTTFRVYFDGEEKDIFQTLFGAATLEYTSSNGINLGLIASAYQSDERVNYGINGEYWIGESLSDEFDASYSTSLGTGSYLDYARNHLKTDVINIGHRGSWKDGHNTLKWGVSVQQEKIDDQITEFQTRDSSGYTLPRSAENLRVAYNLSSDNENETWRTQAFVEDQYRWKTRLGTISLSGGVRAQYWTFNKEWLVSPRATVAFFPSKMENWGFRFSSGLYYQAPFYKEIRRIMTDESGNANVQLNKDIKAQRSLHFVAGSDYYFRVSGRPFKWTTELYFKPADRVETYTVDNLKITYSGTNDAKAWTAGLDTKLFGEFVPGSDSWIGLSLMQSKEKQDGSNEWVSRPNEQRYGVTVFFRDYIPGAPKYKVQLRFVWQDGFPFWASGVTAHRENNTNRSRAYRRVDIGLTRSISKGDYAWIDRTRLFSAVKEANLGIEVFNLLDINNVASYYWVTDVVNIRHAVPNYLTGRQLNLRLRLDF